MTSAQADPGMSLDCQLVRGSEPGSAKSVVQVKGLTGELLKISFQRTVRVPDNAIVSNLPPDMGDFPLYSVASYKEKLPINMAVKGGLFLPMYQREAMWINFESTDKFAIKVHVGGINAVSGEPVIETSATRLRRLNRLGERKSVQDYVVTPNQLWLDGIASTEGRVRQFVAMPIGSGYTVETQVTGEDITGGLQFEITPAEKPDKPVIDIFVRTLNGKTISIYNLPPTATIEQIKEKIEAKEGVPVHYQRLIYQGKYLENRYSVNDYSIPRDATIYFVLTMRGGGYYEQPILGEAQLGIAAGGLIRQCILPDVNPTSIWQRDRGIGFNVQILNSTVFRHVTGMSPPETPVSADTYAREGLPFFDIYNETSAVKGDFDDVKSVQAIEKLKNKNGKMGAKKGYVGEEEEPDCKTSVVVLNPEGAKIGFRSVSELEQELSRMNAVRF